MWTYKRWSLNIKDQQRKNIIVQYLTNNVEKVGVYTAAQCIAPLLNHDDDQVWLICNDDFEFLIESIT